MKYLALTALLIAGAIDIDQLLCNNASHLYWADNQCHVLGEQDLDTGSN